MDRVVVARWPEIERHLLEQLALTHTAMERAESDRELWELKGAAK